MKGIILLLIGVILFVSCTDDSMPLPKPPTYLRLDLPEHKYERINIPCNYDFELSKLYKLKDVYIENQLTCHKDINLGPLNAMIHFSYIDMVEPLSKYVNYAIDKVDEHKIKADEISDQQIIRSKDKVFGTIFELKGNVASPFQFYLTDSTKRFVSGVVYFNCRPNYDSLKPSLDYLKIDLMHLMNTFQWKK